MLTLAGEHFRFSGASRAPGRAVSPATDLCVTMLEKSSQPRGEVAEWSKAAVC